MLHWLENIYVYYRIRILVDCKFSGTTVWSSRRRCELWMQTVIFLYIWWLLHERLLKEPAHDNHKLHAIKAKSVSISILITTECFLYVLEVPLKVCRWSQWEFSSQANPISPSQFLISVHNYFCVSSNFRQMPCLQYIVSHVCFLISHSDSPLKVDQSLHIVY